MLWMKTTLLDSSKKLKTTKKSWGNNNFALHPQLHSKKTDCSSLHERSVGLFLVDLVADVVDVGREVVLGMVVDYVTDVRENQFLEYAVLQVFQEPVESDRFH